MRLVLIAFVSLILSGCATVFSGYESELVIHNCPDSLRVFTSSGIELAKSFDVKSKTPKRMDKNTYLFGAIDSSSCSVELRSNRDYVLVMHDGKKISRYPAYAKLNVWWFALDLACGGVPVIVDAITGDWNYYDPIYLRK